MLVIQIASLIIALLVGSGAALFFIRYGTRLAFVERDSTEALSIARKTDKEQVVADQRLSSMERTIERIDGSLSKLSVLDTIKSTLDGVVERLDDLSRQVVPRPEVEARFKAVTDEMQRQSS